MPTDSISAHLSINKFLWIDEQNQKTGESSRDIMFDWIVNKQGRAFVKIGDKTVFVLGANSPTGQYIRSVEGGKWTDELLKLPEFN